jgi:hypothetical protein
MTMWLPTALNVSDQREANPAERAKGAIASDGKSVQ